MCGARGGQGDSQRRTMSARPGTQWAPSPSFHRLEARPETQEAKPHRRVPHLCPGGPLAGHTLRQLPVVGGQQRVADRGPIEPTSHREHYLQAGDASSILVTRSTERGELAAGLTLALRPRVLAALRTTPQLIRIKLRPCPRCGADDHDAFASRPPSPLSAQSSAASVAPNSVLYPP